ncbi:hypothetical protein MTP99_003129 [Tenebrio molitor]|nr:hypothetical protein MTP99_003129 [Tenebrio molitor]
MHPQCNCKYKKQPIFLSHLLLKGASNPHHLFFGESMLFGLENEPYASRHLQIPSPFDGNLFCDQIAKSNIVFDFRVMPKATHMSSEGRSAESACSTTWSVAKDPT